MTEGGQGLATANNGKYIAVRSTTKWANNIRISRPKKLADFLARKPEAITVEMRRYSSYAVFLQTLSEAEIAELFDSLKEQYGRDIFGQGYLYKIVEDCEIADVDSLTDDEKENGIETTKPYYVPYDKGDKDGNRWYLETPFAIAWSKENVRFLKTDPKARYQGYTFYFREGFCWNNLLNPNARLLKVKLKGESVNDVGSMSLYTTNILSNKYIVALLNSNILFDYYREFINCSVNVQINDIKQLPIIIPTKGLASSIELLADKAIKKKQESANANLESIEVETEDLIKILYSIE